MNATEAASTVALLFLGTVLKQRLDSVTHGAHTCKHCLRAHPPQLRGLAEDRPDVGQGVFPTTSKVTIPAWMGGDTDQG